MWGLVTSGVEKTAVASDSLSITWQACPSEAREWAFVLYPVLSLTLAAPPIGEQLVAAGAGAAIGAWHVHALVEAKLPSSVQPVHFTLVHV